MPVLSNVVARRPSALFPALLALLLAACAAPQSGVPDSAAAEPARTHEGAITPVIAAAPATPVATQPTATAPKPRSKPAPPMSDPLPAERVPAPGTGGAAPRLDVSCKTSADCAVKNVGNCCGAYPRCVNVNAAVDPEAVQARCARSGMASVCGFKPVESCECVQGECRDQMMLFESK